MWKMSAVTKIIRRGGKAVRRWQVLVGDSYLFIVTPGLTRGPALFAVQKEAGSRLRAGMTKQIKCLFESTIWVGSRRMNAGSLEIELGRNGAGVRGNDEESERAHPIAVAAITSRFSMRFVI